MTDKVVVMAAVLVWVLMLLVIDVVGIIDLITMFSPLVIYMYVLLIVKKFCCIIYNRRIKWTEHRTGR